LKKHKSQKLAWSKVKHDMILLVKESGLVLQF